jgi:glycosyltransferase involved in cell wall biosynthesis
VVTSDYSAQRVRLPGASMLPLGVDTRSFSPARPTRGAKNGASFTVVFSARQIEAKGADVLLHALAICRTRGLKIRAVLAGDGPHRVHSQRLAVQLGLTDCVDFPGFVAEERLVELVRSAGTVVVPPLHDECYGLTAAEAMSCGAPVIAAAVGGLPEVVGDAGLLFPAGDAEALADCIAKLAGDPKLRRALGARGRLHAAARLSDQAMVDGYQAIYRDVCSPKAGRRLSAKELA